MATLNLSGYANNDWTKTSYIGWDSTAKTLKIVPGASIVGGGNARATLHSAGHIVKSKDGYFAVDLASNTTAVDAITGFSDTTAGRNWSIAGSKKSALSSISTGSGNDSISLTAGTGAKLSISTGAGNDVVYLSSAADAVTISAGAGNDSVFVGKAADSLKIDLGDGRDSLVVTSVLSKLTINASGSDANYVALSSVDSNALLNVTMGSGNDSILIGGVAAGTLATVVDAGTSKVSGSIALGAGKDYVLVKGDLDKASITGGDGNKAIGIGGTVKDSTITTGSGKDTVFIRNDVTSTNISTGDGNDKISLASGLKESSINAGAGADFVELSGAEDAKVDLGAGNDSIALSGSYADFELTTGAGKDKIDVQNVTDGTVTLTDFDINDDLLLTKVAVGNTNTDADGNINLGTGKVKVNKTNGYYAVHVSVNGGSDSYVAWGSDTDAIIDGSAMKKPLTLYGNTDADVVDTLIGGSKSDTLNVGTGNYAYGGAGNDSIILSTVTVDTQEFVGLAAAGGKDFVQGFQTKATAGDADDADVVYLFQNKIGDLKLKDDNGTLVTKVGTATLKLDGVSTTGDSTINVKDNSGKTYEIDYVGGTASIAADTDAMADAYYGGSDSSSIDFTAVDDEMVVDLSNRGLNVNGTALNNTQNAGYFGKFATVTGGKDTTVMMGSSNHAETLVAGAGDTTLWGGGSKADSLVASSSTDAHQVFYYGAGDGKDTINSSNWGSQEGADILWLGGSTSKVKNDGTNTSVTLSTGDKVVLEGAGSYDQVIQYSTDGKVVRGAKIGVAGQTNNWTYSDAATDYIGGKNNTITVGSDVEVANIWLDGSTGKSYDSVVSLDASTCAGSVQLAGGAASETLIAGTGNSSLWGGAAGDDTMTGGAGVTEFFFGMGNGNDVISASGAEDKVVLYDVALENVASAGVAEDGNMKVTLTDGSTLTVAGSANTYRLADGSTWTYNSENGSWTQA